MELVDRLSLMAQKIKEYGHSVSTEEATKNAFIMPFLSQVLGYDVFDPKEVTPEFTADTGTKKGERVDYAVLKDGVVQILIECKRYGEPLSSKSASQLYRYFSVTNTRIAVLTNGSEYQFFTDIDAPNKMDEKPYLELDLMDIDEHVLPEIEKLTKDSFDIDSIVSSAEGLKYLNEIKKIISSQIKEPCAEFVKFFAHRVYDGGIVTQKVREQFTSLTQKAFSQYIADKVDERLKTALNSNSKHASKEAASEALPTLRHVPAGAVFVDDARRTVTTQDELDGFNIVKAILREVVSIDRLAYRDTQGYLGILLDDNNRKPLCRFHFNRAQKYIGLFDHTKKESRIPIDTLDDIFKVSDQLKETIGMYN